ncbi:MAG: exosome complex exonuclease Rrp41 [Candidatus Anstonellales archaeon]
MENKEIELIVNGKRLDGRGLHDLRPIKIKVGVLEDADGSASVEWGGNKVVAGVYGPSECIPKHIENPYKAVVKCQYMMSTFCSLEEHGRMGPNRRSIEISKVIRQALENVIMVELFPRSQIEVYAIVLQADGGTRISALTAAVAALIDAGIPLRDSIVGLSVGKAGDKIIVDLGKMEDNFGQSDVPIAFTSRDKDILLLQMDGLLTKEELSKMIDLAFKKGDDINQLLRRAIEEKYRETVSKRLRIG